MSEQAYTRVVQALILFIFVIGTLYADPAASAPLRVEPGRAAGCAALEVPPCLF